MKKLLFLLVMVTVVLTACGQSNTNNGSQGNTGNASEGSESGVSTNAETENEGMDKVILGTSADFAPFEFHMTIDGQDTIVGFDIEIAKEIAKDLGAELEIQDMDFDGLLMALNSNKVDFVLAGLNPTEERKENVDLSDIYYFGAHGVLVQKDKADQFQSVDDLVGKAIGVQTGSLQEGIASEIEGAQLTTLARIPELVMELQTGRVDALILDIPVAEQYAKQQENLVVSNVEFDLSEEEAGYVAAVKKGNTELLDSINATLERLKENGDIDRFVVEANELLSQ